MFENCLTEMKYCVESHVLYYNRFMLFTCRPWLIERGYDPRLLDNITIVSLQMLIQIEKNSRIIKIY